MVDAFWRKIPDSLKRRIYHPRAGDVTMRQNAKCHVLHVSRHLVVVWITRVGILTIARSDYISKLKTTLAHGAYFFPRAGGAR